MGTEPHDVLLDAEDLEIIQIHPAYRQELFLKLVDRAVNVRVVHLHRPHSHQTKQLSTLFIAVA